MRGLQNYKRIFTNILFIIKKVFGYCRMRVIVVAIIALLSGVNAVNVTLFYKVAIGNFKTNKPMVYLIYTILVYLCINLLNTVINNLFSGIKIPIWDMKIKAEMSKELYQKYLEIDLNDMQETVFYDKYVRALNEADERSIQVLSTIQSFIVNLFSMIGILSVVAVLDPVLIVFSILPVISSTAINLVINKERYNYDMASTSPERKIEYLQRIFILPNFRQEIRTSIKQDFLFHKLEKASEEKKEIINNKMPSIIKKSVIGANLFSLLNYGVPAIYLGIKLLNNGISVGDFSTLLVGTTNLSSSIFYMVILLPQIASHSMYIDNLRDILEYKSSMRNTKNPIIISDLEKAHSLQMENVSFKYRNNEKYALKNVTLKIRSGEKVAFVGENGAGKSTLVKLFLRLYDPESGEIYIDQHNYKNVDVDSLRNTISSICQDFQLLALSIGENITLEELNEKIDKKRIWDVLNKSGLTSKVKKLSNRLHTTITNEFDEDGISLSGGEAQKLAVSRAMYKNSGILIMDEPSSSLDPRSEQYMYKQILEFGKEKTIIFISHKLYTTKFVDRIYYIENGKIVEQGTHEELMKIQGKYAELYKIQAQQYSEENGLCG